jgi:hypothetical protein
MRELQLKLLDISSVLDLLMAIPDDKVNDRIRYNTPDLISHLMAEANQLHEALLNTSSYNAGRKRS